METLDRIFPAMESGPAMVENLTLGQRQILRSPAFTSTEIPHRLVILDEPTSALDHQTSSQLIRYLQSLQGRKVSCIYISHLLDEVLACTNRILVMKDGRNVGIMETARSSRDKLIEMMGEARILAAEGAESGAGKRGCGDEKNRTGPVIRPRNGGDRDADGGLRVRVDAGEIIGLAGLAGHGQTRLLMEFFDYKRNRNYRIQGPVTFIAGDRQTDGVFPLWSIVKNITLQVYDRLRRLLLIDGAKETRVAEKWRAIVDIKAATLEDNILSLSGGTSEGPLRPLPGVLGPGGADGRPTRGVDVGTKKEITSSSSEKAARAGVSSGTPPRWMSCAIAIGSMSSRGKNPRGTLRRGGDGRASTEIVL